MTTSDPRVPRIEPDPATDHLTGSARADVTVIEYGDFECPSCRLAYPAVKFLLSLRHGPRIRFAFRHFPLREVHPHAEHGGRGGPRPQGRSISSGRITTCSSRTRITWTRST